ncbi:Crp/Fnr family transcriptional regulator [Janthinobacterium sp.]|uniref:Crp/Fnr family transcriptional regulator n=1 Tax=Janthinobacterium sp. TaxID=1871054 RepID=UPI00293D3988|nr:Crp/Fnr family transcriptional regulator [Janthinobacterium sp.]
MPKVNVGGLLSTQALFRDISPFQLEQLRKDVARVELDKGQLLFRKGEAAEGAYIVVYGMIKLSITTPDGGDKVLELIRPGQSFGEPMIFLDEPYPFCAEALDNTLLLRIPPAALLRLLDQSPRIARQMMASLSDHLLGFIRNVERCSVQSATQRVIEYLLQASQLQRSTEVRLELKKSLLASLLNLAPATLSRVLHQLTDLQLIKVSGSLIRIESADALKSHGHAPALAR